MSRPYRLEENNENSHPYNGDSAPTIDETDNSDNSTGMSRLTDEQVLIKSLRLEN